MNEKSVQALSLFDGISGGRVSLEKAGFKINKYHAFEIDKYAMQITNKNYPDTLHYGDVLNSDYREFKDIDILLAGSPCTFWSIAKKDREVDKDGLGWKLFEKFLLALRTTRPKYFLYENVASMPESIKNFITEELGVQPILINSALVSAQQRKRLYWTNIPNVTQPRDRHIYLNDILEDGWFSDRLKSYCIDASYYKGGNLKSYFDKKRRQLVFKRNPNDEDPFTLFTNENIDEIKNGIYAVAQRGRHVDENGSRKDIYGAKTRQRFETSFSQKSNCLTTVQKDSLILAIEKGLVSVRKLTPLETERLQCLPDNYTDCVSNSQRYKAIGNGWTIDVIAHILSFAKYNI